MGTERGISVKKLIELDAALDAFKKELTEGKKRKYVTSCSAIGYEGARRILEGLPSAQQWIPCKERLPSFDFTDVLVCMHDVRHGCEDEYYIASAYVVRGHWKMTLNVDTSDLEIVAWCPLPEPYREDTP